uniref:Putative sister chromatid cohesion protein n=1 Tax=Ornithodoros turicata TaxID=34597 RepID=A0A2R5L3W0_9ACAR
MSRFGAKTYGSRKQPECGISPQLDQILLDRGDSRATTAKMSVAAVHRWGITSFTSLRKAQVNGQSDCGTAYSTSEPASEEADPFSFEPESASSSVDNHSTSANCSAAPKPKKFFKSRNTTPGSLASYTSAHAVAQFDRLKASSSACVSVVARDAATTPIPEDRVDFRCVKLEKALSKDPSGHVADALALATSPIGSPEVPAASVPVPAASSLAEEPVAPRSPVVRTYSRKRNLEPDSESSSKRVLEPCDGTAGSPNPSAVVDEGCLVEKRTEGEEVVNSRECGGSVAENSVVPASEAKAAKSIFKSRKIFQSPKKPKAVYKMRHWHMPDEEEEPVEEEQPPQKQTHEFEEEEDLFEESSLTKEVRPPNQPWKESVTSVKCPRKARQLYTVVRNVKQAHQCHESGETQEFNDDIEYLLESVQSSNPVAARCLSVVGLASKCMVPAFRMHLRAHGIASQFFSALADAPSHPSLSLCTATLFFVLSQDRLTMDLDASTLSLMLQLFESDPRGEGSRQAPLDAKHRDKVHQLCVQMQQKGNAKHLNLNHINTGTLALETLLSLTSRKAGEWFKEELRLQGGLAHIVNTVGDCLLHLGTAGDAPTEFLLDKLRKVDRCSRVLENVTYMNAENQAYLLKYKNSQVVESYIRLLSLCSSSLLLHPVELPEGKMPENQTTSVLLQNLLGPGAAFFSCLLSVLRVLLNITHESPEGSSHVGSSPGLLGSVLLCILQVPRAVPSELRFDLLVLSLGLLINMVEHCEENRARMVDTHTVGWFESVCDDMEMPAINALMDLFTDKMEAANQTEEQADEVLSSREQKVNALQQQQQDMRAGGDAAQGLAAEADDLEETIMKTLQKAGKHMEHSIICAYIALLLGCIIQNNKDFAERLREYTVDGRFVLLVESLRRFHTFINLSGVLGNTATRSIQRVIEVLETS